MVIYGTWKEAVETGVVSDFTPASQDALAWWKIGQRKAQPAVCGGRGTLEKAFSLLTAEWSSLPGAEQSQVNLPEAKSKYETYLIQFTPPAPVGPGR